MKLKVLYDNILAVRKEPEAEKNGLFIPEKYRDRTKEAVVLTTGKGYRNKDGSLTPLEVKEGDTILFGKTGWKEIKHEGETYLVLPESAVLGVITG